VLLKLHPAKIMHVGGVAIHLFQHKFDFRLRDYLLFVYAYDPGLLAKLAGAAAPARPNTKPKIINRQCGSRNDAQYTDQALHAIDFTTDILTNDCALQVRKNSIGVHRSLITAFHGLTASTIQDRAQSGKARTAQILARAPSS